MDMKDNLIRFVNSDRNTINTLRHILKKRNYIWGSGKDLSYDPSLFKEKVKINLIIDPEIKRVYCDPECTLESSKKYFYNIEVIDYNPPW